MKKIYSLTLSLVLLFFLLFFGCGNTASADFDVVEAATTQEYVLQMGQGWNLGNSLDSADCNIIGSLTYETGWGNPRVSRELIAAIKAEGFDTIRIPVSWHNHMGPAPEYTVNDIWMNRVQEIVDWCMEEDLFIILNIHHEKDWLLTASTDYDTVMVKYKALWSQIAERFGSYNEKLIFESMNEIGFDDLGTEKGCELISRMNAEFVDFIRSSGQNNSERYLLLAGYWTDLDQTCSPSYTLPDDDRIMVSVHYYSPSTFAIAEKGTSWGYQETWGTSQDLEYLEGQFDKLKTTFIDKGIPVIIGEYGVTTVDKDEASRILWFKEVTKACLETGCCPVVWDNGEIISRFTFEWKTEGLKEAILGVN